MAINIEILTGADDFGNPLKTMTFPDALAAAAKRGARLPSSGEVQALTRAIEDEERLQLVKIRARS